MRRSATRAGQPPWARALQRGYATVGIFDSSVSTRVLIAAAMAFIPATIAYIRGRKMARFVDDPALPERLFTGQQYTTGSLAVTIAALIMLTGRAAIWAIPLTIIAYFAAGLPLRRLLYKETWSLAVYLSFVIRFFIALWSLWLLVGALPALALWGGERAWIIALVMGAGLFFLGERQADVIRWLIHARPITDTAIRARFDRLVAASGIAAPRFELVDLKGGCVANAFALASLTRSSVIFSGTLLERLDADEVDAICAHELAHLEHYNSRRLRQRRLISRSLIIAAALLTPLMQQLMPSLAWIATAGWPVVVVLVIAFLAQDRQKHETASDLRAVALTGNPEALVRALVKLHAIARVPRRWDADLERHMSHPSLKRRIQDIRGAAGTPPAALGDTAAFASVDGTVRVVLRDEGIEWIEGASSFRLPYERLGELRIAANRTGETSLIAADRTLRRWQMPLRIDDVPRMQAVLDIVDTRVQTSMPDTAVQPMLIRAAAFVVFIVSLHAALFAVAMTLAMTLMRPEAPLVAAAGLAAVAGAVLTWRDPVSAYLIPHGLATTFAAVLLVSGALLIVLAYARRRDEVPPPVWRLVGFLAAAAAASWVLPLLGTSGIDAVGLHQAARGWPSSVVLPLALTGAMMWSSRTPLRVASATGVVASAIAAGVGSQAFLDRFGGDMFLVPAPDVTVRTLDRAVKEFTVPFSIGELQISPNARSIAAVARRQDYRVRIHIGRAGEALTELDADGALFIDDDRALVWTVDGSRTELREVVAGAPDSAGWRLQLTGVSTPTVSLDPASKRWRLASPAGVDVVEAREGAIGSDEISTYRWKVPEGHGAAFMPIALSGERALVLEPRPDLSSPIANPLGAFMFVLASSPHWRSTIWSIGPDGASDLGTSRLELECRPLPRADRGVCRIFDASRTRFFTMDAATRGITAVGSLPGRFFAGEDANGAWMSGWYRSELVAVRLDRADAIRVVGPDDSRPHTLAVSERAAAGVWYQMPATAGLGIDPISAGMGRSLIRVYSIDK